MSQVYGDILQKDGPVKYFVYSRLPFNWFHENCTVLNDNDQYTKYKHSDDYWFGKAAMQMKDNSRIKRTKDPGEASVFIVPSLLNYIAARAKNLPQASKQYCCDMNNEKICGNDLVYKLENSLKDQWWFKRRKGVDHLLVGSHFHINAILRSMPNIQGCSHITFERPQLSYSNARKYRKLGMGLSLPTTYVGIQCNNIIPNFNNVLVSSQLRVNGIHLLGQIDHRGAYQERKHICSAVASDLELKEHSFCASSSSIRYSVYGNKTCDHHNSNFVECTIKDKSKSHQFYCDSLVKAPIVIHSRGDTFGSSRLMDALTNGAIPIFTHPEQYAILPFSRTLLWQSMSVMMQKSPSSDVNETLHYLQLALQEVDTRKNQLRKNIKKYREMVSWNAPESTTFDTYLTVFHSDLRFEEKILI